MSQDGLGLTAVDVRNLISAFSKSSLNIWKFSIQILLKLCLENFEHYFASMWDECNCAVVWAFFGIGIREKTDLFQPCGHCWVFQICWHVDCSTFTVSSFRVCPQLALFIVMFPKAHLTLHSRMSGSRSVITPWWLSGSLRSFYIVLLCILATYSTVHVVAKSQTC